MIRHDALRDSLMKKNATWRARNWLALLLVLIGLSVFAGLSDEVLEGSTHAFDRSLLLKLRNPSEPSDPIGPGWVEELFRDLTALGGPGVLTLVTLAAAGFLAMERRVGSVILLLVAVGGGVILVSLLKLGFDRPRPDLALHGLHTHVQLSQRPFEAVCRDVPHSRRAPFTHASQAVGENLPVLPGNPVDLPRGHQSRVSGGSLAHGRSVAGWTVGGCWALLCWLVAGWIQRRADSHAAGARR